MARKKVPKKNISSRLADIREPGGGPVDSESGMPSRAQTEVVLQTVARSAEEAEHGERKREPRSSGRPGTIFLIVAGGALAVVLVFAANFFYARREFLRALHLDLPALQSALGDAALPAEEAAPRSFTLDFRGAYRDLKDVTSHVYGFLNTLSEIRSGWPDVLLGGGGKFATRLKDVQGHVTALEALERGFLSGASPLQSFLPFSRNDYLVIDLHLARLKGFLDAFVPWLDAPPVPRRFLVFLANTSELRPGGGFLGSYAEIALERGDVKQVVVRDVNEPDRELQARIIPPQPLQPKVGRLRAADANWFFDFPTSARKTVEFLEASEFYKRQGIVFDGALAVTPRVVQDILAVTGPVELSRSRLVMNERNFVSELQKQVTEGERRGDPYPKKVLSEFFPALMEKARGLSASDRERIANHLGEWFAHKDAMVYLKEREFERFFDAYDLAGKVYDLPDDFYGDYLAVVHANVGGGKTDAVMKERVEVQTQIGADGMVQDRLVVERTHGGARSEFPWYRLPHEDYLQVFTAPAARLTNASGGRAVKVVPRVNYKTGGYAADPDVRALEATARTDLRYPGVTTLREDGKNVFATWVRTPPGAVSRATFDYEFRLLAPPAEGSVYRFVFEKQSGAAATYAFTFNAPVGFRFRGNNLPIYEHETSDPPGRLTLTLTLEKLDL